ncbi:MAG: hypothetical protein Q9217_001907 [Psora testacea]
MTLTFSMLNGVIAFRTCWMLFEPGILNFGMKAGQPAVAGLGNGQQPHYHSYLGMDSSQPNRQASLISLGTEKKVSVSKEGFIPDVNKGEEYEDGNERRYEVADCSDYASELVVDKASAAKGKPAPLTKTHLLRGVASLRGCSLRNKEWLMFSVDFAKDIKYNEGAFVSLVLPSEHRELILALMQSQTKETFHNVIQGKIN